jgi:hypothetical protein
VENVNKIIGKNGDKAGTITVTIDDINDPKIIVENLEFSCDPSLYGIYMSISNLFKDKAEELWDSKEYPEYSVDFSEYNFLSIDDCFKEPDTPETYTLHYKDGWIKENLE